MGCVRQDVDFKRGIHSFGLVSAARGTIAAHFLTVVVGDVLTGTVEVLNRHLEIIAIIILLVLILAQNHPGAEISQLCAAAEYQFHQNGAALNCVELVIVQL